MLALIWISGFEASARLGIKDNGSITMTDIGKCLNPKAHPMVISKKMAVNEALTKILESLNIYSEGGVMGADQFIEYYIKKGKLIGTIGAYVSYDAVTGGIFGNFHIQYQWDGKMYKAKSIVFKNYFPKNNY